MRVEADMLDFVTDEVFLVYFSFFLFLFLFLEQLRLGIISHTVTLVTRLIMGLGGIE